MSKYIDADKLRAEIERQLTSLNRRPLEMRGDYVEGLIDSFNRTITFITSLQQEQLETDVKSPFTGGKVAILSREEEVTFRGEKVKITRKYYRCEDTGGEFTDSKLDDDMMWAAFRAYCEKKGMTSFTDIMLKQEQPEVDEIELDGMAIDFRNSIKPKPHTRLYYEEQIYNAYKAGFRKGFNARKV